MSKEEELKTLKDLIKKQHFKGVPHPLKDYGIKENSGGIFSEIIQHIIIPEDLKQEAIKRYLHFTEMMNKSLGHEWYYFKGKCDELVENFNITEEDLKGGK